MASTKKKAAKSPARKLAKPKLLSGGNPQIAKGFGRGIMPQDFGQTLSKQQLDALVTYLHDSTNK